MSRGGGLAVAVDATAFISDWSRSSIPWLLFGKFVREGKAQLLVPRVTVQEVLNHQREESKKVLKDLNTAARKLSHLGAPGPLATVTVSHQDIVDAYARTSQSWLEEHRTSILDYDQIPHHTIVDRDLARRRPFQLSGKGYRDALFWELALSASAHAETLAIVTANRKDFCDKDGALHPDLLQDLDSHGIPANRIQVCKDIGSFLGAFGPDWNRVSVNYQRLSNNLAAFLENHGETLWDDTGGRMNSDDFFHFGFSGPFQINGLERWRDIEAAEGATVDEDSGKKYAIVEGLVTATADISGFMSKSDFYTQEDSLPLTLEYGDWNDHTVSCSLESDIHIELLVRATLPQWNVVQVDVRDVIAGAKDSA